MRAFIKTLQSLWLEYNEFVGIPLAVLAFLVSAQVLTSLDPTAAVLDTGLLQLVAYGAVKLISASAIAFLGLRANFPAAYKTLVHRQKDAFSRRTDEDLLFNNQLRQLEDYQTLDKQWLRAAGLYCCYLWAALYAMHSL